MTMIVLCLKADPGHQY